MIGGIGAGGSALAASQAALAKLDKTMAETTTMQAAAQDMKMRTDTNNAITEGKIDSGSKATNALTKAGKAIQY